MKLRKAKSDEIRTDFLEKTGDDRRVPETVRPR